VLACITVFNFLNNSLLTVLVRTYGAFTTRMLITNQVFTTWFIAVVIYAVVDRLGIAALRGIGQPPTCPNFAFVFAFSPSPPPPPPPISNCDTRTHTTDALQHLNPCIAFARATLAVGRAVRPI
jgi:hypothetical protein